MFIGDMNLINDAQLVCMANVRYSIAHDTKKVHSVKSVYAVDLCRLPRIITLLFELFDNVTEFIFNFHGHGISSMLKTILH